MKTYYFNTINTTALTTVEFMVASQRFIFLGLLVVGLFSSIGFPLGGVTIQLPGHAPFTK